MKRLGTILLMVFSAIVFAWGGFIVGRGKREHNDKTCVKRLEQTNKDVGKCAQGFGECMNFLKYMEGELIKCRLKLPRE